MIFSKQNHAWYRRVFWGDSVWYNNLLKSLWDLVQSRKRSKWNQNRLWQSCLSLVKYGTKHFKLYLYDAILEIFCESTTRISDRRWKIREYIPPAAKTFKNSIIELYECVLCMTETMAALVLRPVPFDRIVIYDTNRYNISRSIVCYQSLNIGSFEHNRIFPIPLNSSTLKITNYLYKKKSS